MFKSLSSFFFRRDVLWPSIQIVRSSHHVYSTILSPIDPDSDIECLYENYLNRPDIDGWEVRKAFCELHGMDLIPSPPVIIAGLKACRRINEYALAVRLLEAVKFKCADKVLQKWPYIKQEIQPTLDELGVDTPGKLGYDKPELWLHVEDW